MNRKVSNYMVSGLKLDWVYFCLWVCSIEAIKVGTHECLARVPVMETLV